MLAPTMCHPIPAAIDAIRFPPHFAREIVIPETIYQLKIQSAFRTVNRKADVDLSDPQTMLHRLDACSAAEVS